MPPSVIPLRAERRSDVVERALIERILDGTYPVGSTLPLERELATAFEVGRPTLREALQRLERDGWVASVKGKGTLVQDYLRTGTLNTLGPILRTGTPYAQRLIVHMLEIRALLLPDAARGAVAASPAKVVAALAPHDGLGDAPEAYAQFDWDVNRALCLLSPNPVFHLILRSMDPPYEDLSTLYFSDPANRRASADFYAALTAAGMARDPDGAHAATAAAMDYAIGWFQRLGGEAGDAR